MNGTDNIGKKKKFDENIKSDENTKSEEDKIFLANLIRIFHLFIILFILIAPFTNLTALLILHITFSISLLVHWVCNSNECSLTLLESQLRGLPKNESFSYKFISPMYDISNSDWSRFCYVITIFLMCISIYNLYYSEKLAKTMKCFSERTKIDDSFYKRMFIFFDCFKELLII